jgi:threonine synthase
MRYTSTRNNSVDISSAQAIKQGLSEEGGLLIPVDIPHFSEEEIASFAPMSYQERAFQVLRQFLTDYSDEELKDCISKAYSKEKFETEVVAPVYKYDSSVYFLELWHGPTCAFKDVALQILPHFLTKAMKKTGETREVVILVATSGDTGKAALEGFKDVNGTRIIVFYPKRGVSEIQKLQMVTQEGNNVGVAAVEGNFDDAQNGVKIIFTNKDYQEFLSNNGFVLSSANSINWGRLVPQIVYYFSAYAELLKNGEIKKGESINVCVPTGNFGNILAAYYAKEMGVPIAKLICASNKNNVLTNFINSGLYDKNRPFYTTTSPSMDILISSNLERFLYLLSDTRTVKSCMEQLKTDGKYQVDERMLAKMRETMWGGFCDDSAAFASLKDVNDKGCYVMDTHTAVAKCVYDQYVAQTGDKTKTVIASTASPFKFSQSVLMALDGIESVAGKDEFALLKELEERAGIRAPKALTELANKRATFNITCKKDEMEQMVNEFLNI